MSKVNPANRHVTKTTERTVGKREQREGGNMTYFIIHLSWIKNGGNRTSDNLLCSASMLFVTVFVAKKRK